MNRKNTSRTLCLPKDDKDIREKWAMSIFQPASISFSSGEGSRKLYRRKRVPIHLPKGEIWRHLSVFAVCTFLYLTELDF